ncbi:hypothetical protein HII36_29965 [Nonomuraea sp. NN258]|uniref:hypothetical protein n=1 Tax=Nonomuraea antri TaxID=2730852 RepID=UPI0015694E2F|nr:hypothetical protein [Nonomuraea antri]NRQ36028.1 hypothetical protein [Nonomuraea antri]
MRALWLAAGTLLTVAVLIVTATGLVRGFAWAEPPVQSMQRSMPFTGDEIKVKASTGDVAVHFLPGEAGELVILRHLRWSRDKPVVTENLKGDTLRLDADCKPLRAGIDTDVLCEATYTLLVPPEIRIEAESLSGPLSVSNVFGDVHLTSVSGDLDIRATPGNVWARTDSGSVVGSGLGGDEADVAVGTGDVDLSFIVPPTKVKAVVRAGGAARVAVPESSYDVTVQAQKSDIDLESQPTSHRKINISAPKARVFLCWC